jgi:hypothetical protein
MAVSVTLATVLCSNMSDQTVTVAVVVVVKAMLQHVVVWSHSGSFQIVQSVARYGLVHCSQYIYM